MPTVKAPDTHDLPPDPEYSDYWIETDYLDNIRDASRQLEKAQDHNRKARKLAKEELRQALERAVYGAPSEAAAEAIIETVAPDAVPGYEIDWSPVIGNIQGLRALIRRLERDASIEARMADEDDIEVLLLLMN